MAFLVSEKHLEALRELLTQFAQNFSYWRYFDIPDPILPLDLTAQITQLNSQRKSFLEYIAPTNPSRNPTLSRPN